MIGAALILASAPAFVLGDRLLMIEILGAADWAQLANHYLEMGEERATAALIERSQLPKTDGLRIDPNERVGLMMRLLYEPAEGKQLRAPRLGSFGLPYRSMPASTWPTYPFVEQGGVVFLMSGLLGGTGIPESGAQYSEYCRSNGTFRSKKYLVPDEATIKGALDSLYKSPRWQGLEWSSSCKSESYTISPGIVTGYLAKQIRPEW